MGLRHAFCEDVGEIRLDLYYVLSINKVRSWLDDEYPGAMKGVFIRLL